jgi:diguanylate cyclase (GGDEF)-like protein
MGTVSVQNMMDAMAKVQVELAKGANPLTGLPGNVMIEMEIQRREKQKILSSFLYLDLDNFKVYNDVYGFRNGDRVLKMTARILKNAVAREGADSDFIGHIGGDDFFIVTDPAHAEPVARTITQCFSAEIPGMYNETDRQCGYILGVSRDGREGRFPFISVSIGIIDCTFEHPFSLEELSERAADIKKYAKSQTGNIYLKDRRPALGATPK